VFTPTTLHGFFFHLGCCGPIYVRFSYYLFSIVQKVLFYIFCFKRSALVPVQMTTGPQSRQLAHSRNEVFSISGPTHLKCSRTTLLE
jgi:hypothetical protein